jgi:hypothetical protein
MPRASFSERDNLGGSEMLASFSRSSAKSEHEGVRAHDPLEAVVSDRLGDVKQPIPVFKDRRIIDEKYGVKLGQNSASPYATSERGHGATPFVTETLMARFPLLPRRGAFPDAPHLFTRADC